MARGTVLGTVSYNGFEFPGPCVVSLRCTPVRDTANRITKYYHYAITIITTIVPSDCANQTTNDPWLGTLRASLMQPGQSLEITGHGHGDDLTNINGSTCLNFGPVPVSYDFSIIGANLAGRLTWSVEFDTTHCGSTGISSPTNSRIGENNWGTTYSIDESGLTTRTIAGTLEILVHIQGIGIDDTADRLIDEIAPNLPEGFRRSKIYSVSADKRILSYTVVDREIGTRSVYPDNIVKADIEFTMDSMLPAGSSMPYPLMADMEGAGCWGCSIDGSMEVAQGYAKGFAVQAVIETANQRMQALSTAQNKDQAQGQVQSSISPTILLANFHLRDSLYSQKIDVSFSWIVCSLRLADILSTYGMWEPIGQGRTWSNWQQSDGIKKSIINPRGYANLSSPANTDVIVSFCQQGAPFAPPATQPNDKPYSNSGLGASSYDEQTSWLNYELSLSYGKESSTMLHNPMSNSTDSQNALAPTNTGSGGSATGGIGNSGTHYVEGQGNVPNSVPPSLQERGPAEVILILQGRCVRVGIPIKGSDLAYIATVGGQKANTVYEWIDGPKRVGFTADRIPIYGCTFIRRYRVLNSDVTSVVEPNSVPSNVQKFIKYP